MAEGERWMDWRDQKYLTGLDHYELWERKRRGEVEKISRVLP